MGKPKSEKKINDLTTGHRGRMREKLRQHGGNLLPIKNC